MRNILALCSAVLLCASTFGCARRVATERAAPSASASAALPARHAGLPAAAAPKGGSVYELDLPLVDQDGQRIRLDTFRGHRVIVSMFYGSCPFACPTLISDIRNLERRLSPQVRAELRVLLVSFDPEHDTSAALSELVKVRELDRSRWKLATGSDDSVRELSAVLGIKYRKLPSGGFNHTSLITLLDRDGTLLARSEGLQGSNDELVAALQGES
jgi:protein SCO1/2